MAERQLFKTVLKAGVHVGPDFTKEPDRVPLRNVLTGEPLRHPVSKEPLMKDVYPEVTVKRGDVYYSERDLASEDPNRWDASEKRARTRVAVPVGASLGVENGAEAHAPNAAPPTLTADELEELNQLTKPELLSEAERRGVKADDRMNKAQIVAAIKAGPLAPDDGE